MTSFTQIISFVLIGGMFVVVILIVVRLFRSRFAKPITTEAKVIDKRTSNYMSYFGAPHNKTDYILVFQCNNKTLSFLTSFWNYDCVKKGQHGKLTYKGNQMIHFK